MNLFSTSGSFSVSSPRFYFIVRPYKNIFGVHRIIVLLFTLANLIPAQNKDNKDYINQWELSPGSEGIPIADIDIYTNNPDTIYAFGDNFLISTNNGESWNIINGPSTDMGALKVDHFNSKVIYVSHYGIDPESNDISITTDGGQTWNYLFMGRRHPSPIVEIDPVDLITVYVVQGPGILHRSVDYFQTWESIYPPANDMTSLQIATSDNNIIYAGYNSEILKSTDKGESWIKLPFPITYNSWIMLAVQPHNADLVYSGIFSFGYTQGGVYKTNDGGLTWNEINNGLDNSNWDINTILINPKNSDELFIGVGSTENKLIFRTLNGGNSWFEFDNGLPDSSHVTSIRIDTTNYNLYAGINASDDSSGIYTYKLISHSSLDPPTPNSFILYQNYPNPFNPSTKINFEVPNTSLVSLKIYDVLGREINELVNEFKPEGKYEIIFDESGLPSGVYFYQLKTKDFVSTKKMILLR